MIFILTTALASEELESVDALASWSPELGDHVFVEGVRGGTFQAGPPCTPDQVLTWATSNSACAYRQWNGALLNAVWAGLALSSEVDDSDGLRAADEAASANGAALLLSSLDGTVFIDQDLTLLAPLVVTNTTMAIGEGRRVTLAQPLTAGREPVFSTGWGKGEVALPSGHPWYPEWWGLVPDSEVDSYDGWFGMIKSANAAGANVSIEMRPGAYRIQRYRISGGPDANGYDVLRFDGIDGLTINGNGAEFHSFGAFHRRLNAPNSKSYDNEIGLQVFRSSNVAIRDLTLHGHVEAMTRDSGVIEGGGNHGLYFSGNSGVLVERVESSYWAADGFYLQSDGKGQGPEVVPRHFLFREVTARHNRRQGMSIIQGNDIVVQDADFSFQGSAMPYGSHSPSAGVDIEPHQRPCDHPEPGSTCTDLVTGGIVFDGLRVHGNRGFCFVAEDTNKIDDVTIRNMDCDVGEDTPGSGGSGFLLSVRKGLVEDSVINVRDRHWYLNFSQNYHFYPSDLTARRVVMRAGGGSDSLSKTGHGGLPETVTFEDVDVLADPLPAPAWGSYVIRLAGGEMTWTGGRVFLPAGMHDGAGVDYYVKIQDDIRVSNVTFATDLDTPGLHFGISAGTATFCNVVMESPVNQIARGASPKPTGTVYTDPECP